MFSFPKNKKPKVLTNGHLEKAIEQKKSKITRILERFYTAPTEIAMVSSILDLETMTARDIMIPRIDVQVVNIAIKKTELIQLLTNKNLNSRLPVYENNVDNIKGILHVKDLFSLLIKNKGKPDLQKQLSEPFFVPESKKILEILHEFQAQHIHLAIVVDEYGGFAGILTMEDIIEEIIGDVQDEFDSENQEIKKLDENIYSIDARTDLETFNQYFSLELPDEEADTLGGYIIMRLGYIPKMGQSLTIDQTTFKIIKKRKNSLIRIRMQIKKPNTTS